MGLAYRVLWILKALWIVWLKPSIFWEIAKNNFRRFPREFYHRFMYKASSCNCPLQTLNLPLKMILRRFEIVYRCLKWECCTFQKTDKFYSNPPILYYGLLWLETLIIQTLIINTTQRITYFLESYLMRRL